jgi:hypothetical protein
LAKRYPKVKVDPEPIWVQDDNFYTSAGVTAGIDLSLALLEEDHGAALALERLYDRSLEDEAALDHPGNAVVKLLTFGFELWEAHQLGRDNNTTNNNTITI